MILSLSTLPTRRNRRLSSVAVVALWLAQGCNARSASPDASVRTDTKAAATTPATSDRAPSLPDAEPSARDWQAECAAAQSAQFPASDQPTAADKAALKSGDSRRYYYGIGVAKDYVRARHAALSERDKHDGAFAASTILMMLYANGQGVERNLPLAIKLACEQEEQPREELSGRVSHLRALKTSGAAFDFCDDVSGGEMEGYCATLAEERKAAERGHELDDLIRDWPAEQRARLQTLRAALKSFATMRARRERDLSGTDQGTLIAETEAALHERFANALREFEAGKLPSHDAEQLVRADAELNRVYKEALAKDFSDTTITAAGIKATEKAWLAYRDAWLALAALRYPAVPAEAFKTWLTQERTEQLQNL